MTAPIALIIGLSAVSIINLERWKGDRLDHQPRHRLIAFTASIAASVVAILVFFYFHRAEIEAQFAVVATALIVVGMVVSRFTAAFPVWSQIGYVSVAIALSWTVGYFTGDRIVISQMAPYKVVVDGTAYEGTLLYGGENGVLFFVPNLKRTYYFRFDSIKSLSRDTPGAK